MRQTRLLLKPATALLVLAMTFSIVACEQKSPEPAPMAAAAPSEAPDETTIPDASAPVSYEADLEFIDLVFKLKTHGNGARRLFTVAATRGGAVVGEPGKTIIEGAITTAFAADLNGDRKAEIVVFTKSLKGSAGFVTLAFDDSAYKEYRLPEPETALRSDAAGPDEYAFENGLIVRRFPTKAGGTRTLRYRFDPATGFAAEANVGG